MLDAEIGEADAAAAAQQTPFPVEVNVPVVPELSLIELTQVWTLGVGSDRSLGRPKEWNGEPSGFGDFAFKFSNWLSGLPGDAERFLEESVTMAQPIQWATLTPREKVVARGVATALRALIGGKALSCIRQHPEKLNGFEMWRLLYREYKPETATRKVGLLERVMDDQPAPGMDFGDWFFRWLDLVGECEKAHCRMIDDDIKVAVMLNRSPKELRDHLVLENPQPGKRGIQVSCDSSETANGSCSGQYCCERFRCDSVCSWLAWILARKGTRYGMVVVGWLGRGSTTLHCTHHALPPHLRQQSFFSFSFSFGSLFLQCVMFSRVFCAFPSWHSVRTCSSPWLPCRPLDLPARNLIRRASP